MGHNLKTKIKDLWSKAKYKLIEVLGGYVYPPCPPNVPKPNTETLNVVPVSASIIVDKQRFDYDVGYKAYVKQDLARILAEHIIQLNVISSDSIVELNDEQYAVKVAVQLVRGEGLV